MLLALEQPGDRGIGQTGGRCRPGAAPRRRDARPPGRAAPRSPDVERAAPTRGAAQRGDAGPDEAASSGPGVAMDEHAERAARARLGEELRAERADAAAMVERRLARRWRRPRRAARLRGRRPSAPSTERGPAPRAPCAPTAQRSSARARSRIDEGRPTSRRQLSRRARRRGRPRARVRGERQPVGRELRHERSTAARAGAEVVRDVGAAPALRLLDARPGARAGRAGRSVSSVDAVRAAVLAAVRGCRQASRREPTVPTRRGRCRRRGRAAEVERLDASRGRGRSGVARAATSAAAGHLADGSRRRRAERRKKRAARPCRGSLDGASRVGWRSGRGARRASARAAGRPDGSRRQYWMTLWMRYPLQSLAPLEEQQLDEEGEADDLAP